MEIIDRQTKALNDAFMEKEPHSLNFISHEDITTDTLYYGEGCHTNLGRLATIRIDEDGRHKASGYVLNNGIIMPLTEDLAIRWAGSFRPLKPLLPVSPDLTGKHLAKWTFRLDLAYTRRQIVALHDYPEWLKEAPAYSEYLEYLNNVIGVLEKVERNTV